MIDNRLNTCSFCRQVLSVILAKLFNLLISCSYVPDGFRYSYIAPIPKMKEFFL